MPRKGFKCITIDEALHAKIKERAKETDRTMQEYIEYLLARQKAANNLKTPF